MKEKIFIDLDGTVIDTAKFRDQIFAVFLRQGFTLETLVAAYRTECLNYNFSLKKYTDILYRKKKFNISLLNARIDFLFQSIPKLIFPDVLDFIYKVDKSKFELILLTLGNPEFQKLKFENSGLTRYFDKVYYCEEQKWIFLDSIVGKNERFILLDDRGDTVDLVRKRFPGALAIEVDRKSKDCDDPAIGKKEFGNIKVKDFAQVARYINL